MVSCPPRPRMQSAPAVPVMLSLFEVPMITWVPAGQQLGSSPRTAVTVWGAVRTLPKASVKVHVTTVEPRGKVVGALLSKVTGPQALETTGRGSEGIWQVRTVTGGSGATIGGWSHMASSGGVPDGVNADAGRSTGLRFCPVWTMSPGPSCHAIGSATTIPCPDVFPSQVI